MDEFICYACSRNILRPMDERNCIDIDGNRRYLCNEHYQEYILNQERKHGENKIRKP